MRLVKSVIAQRNILVQDLVRGCIKSSNPVEPPENFMLWEEVQPPHCSRHLLSACSIYTSKVQDAGTPDLCLSHVTVFPMLNRMLHLIGGIPMLEPYGVWSSLSCSLQLLLQRLF
jgi:hypothetical protein